MKKYWAIKLFTEGKKYNYYTDHKTGNKKNMLQAFADFNGGDILDYNLPAEVSNLSVIVSLEERNKTNNLVLKVLDKKEFKLGKIEDYKQNK